jgi:hypothetical protein
VRHLFSVVLDCKEALLELLRVGVRAARAKKERESACLDVYRCEHARMCARAYASVCVYLCVYVCVRAQVCVCVLCVSARVVGNDECGCNVWKGEERRGRDDA